MTDHQNSSAGSESAPPKEWRCFHCDEVFTDAKAAANHFGVDHLGDETLCQMAQVDGGIARVIADLSEELQRYRMEDNTSYREFYALGADHRAALIKEEQKGYDRGVADARADLSGAPAQPTQVRAVAIEECAKIADDFAAYEQTVVDRAHADKALSDTGRKNVVLAAGSRQVAAEQIAYDIRAVLASQPSPAATVETKPVLAAAVRQEEPATHSGLLAQGVEGPRSSAGNGDAGCGAAVITPWADQYNACWDRSKPDALKLAALKALNYIENTEDELGMKLSCGDALREALK